MLTFALQVVAPVALCVGAGWLLGRYRGISSQALARAVVDVFGPALLLANIPTGLLSHWRIVLVLLGTIAAMMGLAALAARVLPIRNRDQYVAVLLGATLCNFGFFGLPVVESALGSIAFSSAMIVMLVLNIPTGFLSAYFSSPKPGVRSALVFTFSSPFNWAVVAAIGLGIFSIQLPDAARAPVGLVAQAAVPTGLIVLGIDLSRIRLASVPISILAATLGLRLLVAPALVMILTVLFGLTGDKILAQSAVLQLATPSGITPLIFMASVGRDTSTMAGIVFWSTLCSLVTIPLVAILIVS